MSGVTDQATEPRQAFSARVPISLWEAMEDAKRDRHGGDRTALVEAALRNHLNLPAAEQGPEAGSGNGTDRRPVQAPPRLLVDVVAERLNLPGALARRMIERGRITFGGVTASEPDAPARTDEPMALDGSPV